MDDRTFLWKAQSITPLIMNSNVGLLGGTTKGETRDKEAWEREHFRELAYVNADGGLYIPARAIKKCLILAPRFSARKPKGVAFKSFMPIIEAALIVNGDAPLGVTVDALQAFPAVVNLDPSKGPKGPKGVRTRPMLPVSWSCSTTLTVMDDLLTADILSEMGELSGKRCGLLDGRAIDYGRCYITITEQ